MVSGFFMHNLIDDLAHSANTMCSTSQVTRLNNNSNKKNTAQVSISLNTENVLHPYQNATKLTQSVPCAETALGSRNENSNTEAHMARTKK